MDLEELLRFMDRTSANLSKLDEVWERAEPMISTGPTHGTTREYEDLRRIWTSLLKGLPELHGWKVTAELPDIDDAGRQLMEYSDTGKDPSNFIKELHEPRTELDEYRFRLGQSRRAAIRDRLEYIMSGINGLLPAIVKDVPRDSQDSLNNMETIKFEKYISEIERLLGDTISRNGRWGDLHRHMRFGEGHDWHDIVETDWPSVKHDIDTASTSDSDPIPVPEVDLGHAATASPTGSVTTGLDWTEIDDSDFERLLFDLLREFPNYQNVEWLQKTQAPDRGRDLSAERVIRDDGGSTRTERTIIQAKHWKSKSVSASEITHTLGSLSLFDPPFRVLVIATSGRFTSDAVTVAEKHNSDAQVPLIELWPDSRLETLLSQRPDLTERYGLRQ